LSATSVRDAWLTVANARALAAGLTFRPLVDTVGDTWRWLGQVTGDDHAHRRAARTLAIPAGLSRERERRLLAEHAARAAAAPASRQG